MPAPFTPYEVYQARWLVENQGKPRVSPELQQRGMAMGMNIEQRAMENAVKEAARFNNHCINARARRVAHLQLDPDQTKSGSSRTH